MKNSKPNYKSRLRVKSWGLELPKTVAVSIIVASIGLFYLGRQTKQLTTTTNMISAPSRQRINITLADGTKVSMRIHCQKLNIQYCLKMNVG